MKRNRLAALTGVALLAAVAGTGCDTKATTEKLAQAEGQVAQLTLVAAQKDSLLQLVAENTKAMSEISSELANVRNAKKPAPGDPAEPGVSTVAYRERMTSRIKDIVARVNQAETRLVVAQRRADSMGTQFGTAQQAIADLKSTLDNQRMMVASLEEQVRGLQQEKTTLLAEKTELEGARATLTGQTAALTDTVRQMDMEAHKVYYVIGTKDELKSKGIITEEGTKFLFFGGKSLVPARTLDPSAFTAVDSRQLGEIALPKSDKNYKIVTRQNLMYLSEQPTKDGQVKGSAIHITQPDAFWAPSPYLIIVEG